MHGGAGVVKARPPQLLLLPSPVSSSRWASQLAGSADRAPFPR